MSRIKEPTPGRRPIPERSQKTAPVQRSVPSEGAQQSDTLLDAEAVMGGARPPAPIWPSMTAAAAGPPVQAKVEAGQTSPAVTEVAEQGLSGPGSRLPHFEKLQRAFGHHDLSGVRAHGDSQAQHAARAMGAEAFTRGRDVAFARQPTLHTAAHEAAHAIQQQAGVQLLGGVGRVGDPYEQHADAVADQVVRGQSAERLLDAFATPRTSTPAAPAIQMKKAWETRINEICAYWEGINEGSAAELRAYLETLQDHGEALSEGVSRHGVARDDKSNSKAKRKELRAKAFVSAINDAMRQQSLNKTLPPRLLADLTQAQLGAQPGGDTRQLRDTMVNGLNLIPVGTADVTEYTHGRTLYKARERNYTLYRPAQRVTAYHATRPQYVNSIIQSALNPGLGGGEGAVGTAGVFNAPGYVYLTDTAKKAEGIGKNFYGKRTQIAILAVTLDTDMILVADPDMEFTAVRTTCPIPGTQIVHHSTFNPT